MTDPEKTLRDEFAIAAIPSAMEETYGLDWGKANKVWPDRVASKAYRIADAMVRARKEGLS